jgi:predicted acetyltransferase
MGQAKNRGTLEDRITQAQNRHIDTPPINLKPLNPKSPQWHIDTFCEYNIDYLSNYGPRGMKSVINEEQATKMVYESINEWISHPNSFVYVAFDSDDNMVGYTTVHERSSAEYHSKSTDRLIEDIYVAPKYRHKGYMSAIRKQTQSKQSLVDKATLIKHFNYYKRIGMKSFDIMFYKKEQFDTTFPIMKGTVAVRYDNKGECDFTLKNLYKTIQKDDIQMSLNGLETNYSQVEEA